MNTKRTNLSLEILAFPVAALILTVIALRLFPPPPIEPPDPTGSRTFVEKAELRPLGMGQAIFLHKQKAAFIDLRPEAEYRAERIPKAIHIGQIRKIQPTGPIVLYGGPENMESIMTEAERLVATRAGTVYVLMEGIEGWRTAGFPLDKGD